MIKLSAPRHAAFSKVMKKLAFLGYFATLGFFIWVATGTYKEARNIIAEQETIEAVLNFDGITETRRKRRTSYTYNFSYAFEVNGVEYGSEFSSSESNADKFIGRPTITVAYKRSDPTIHDRLEVIERNSSVTSVITRILIALPLLALVVSLVYLLLTHKLVTARKDETQLA